MIVCGMYDISVQYGANQIFSETTLEINKKDRIGVVGPNGSGKTTLLRVISGSHPISDGRIYWQRNLRSELLEQIPSIAEQVQLRQVLMQSFTHLGDISTEMSELEAALADNRGNLDKNLQRYGYLQERFALLGGYEMDAQIRRVSSGLKLMDLLDHPWGQLSGGERTRAGLALILLHKPDLLLLDEPTNHLDIAAVEWLTEYLKEYPGTLVIVSHDRYFLDQVAEIIVEADGGTLTVYHQNYSGYKIEREDRLLQEFQKYQDQQKKIKKMKEAIKRLRDWANRSKPPSDSLNRRASSMEKALAKLNVIAKPLLQAQQIELELPIEKRSSEKVFILENVSKRFGSQILFRDVEFTVSKGERIAIVGENGSGKSTLLRIMLGETAPETGSVYRGVTMSVGYLSQHGEELVYSSTVVEEFRRIVPVSEAVARHILARFLFFGEKVFQSVGSLSGGERMRLRWAQMMHCKHNVLILDEPTNHMDTDSREVLEEALGDFPGTVVAVSHDRYFLDRYFPVTYWIANNQLHHYPGNYSYARSKRSG